MDTDNKKQFESPESERIYAGLMGIAEAVFQGLPENVLAVYAKEDPADVAAEIMRQVERKLVAEAGVPLSGESGVFAERGDDFTNKFKAELAQKIKEIIKKEVVETVQKNEPEKEDVFSESEAVEQLKADVDGLMEAIEQKKLDAGRAIVNLIREGQRCKLLLGDAEVVLALDDDQKAKLEKIYTDIKEKIEILQSGIHSAEEAKTSVENTTPETVENVETAEVVDQAPIVDTSMSTDAEDVVPPENIPPAGREQERSEKNFEIPMYLVSELFSEVGRREQFKNFYETLFVGEIVRQVGGEHDVETYVNVQVSSAFEELLAVEASEETMESFKKIANRAGVEISSWEDVKEMILRRGDKFLNVARMDVEHQARVAIAEALPIEWKKTLGKTGLVVAAAAATSFFTGTKLSDFDCFKNGASAVGRGALVGGAAGVMRGLIQQFGFDNDLVNEWSRKNKNEKTENFGRQEIEKKKKEIFDVDDERKVHGLAMRFGSIYETVSRDLEEMLAGEDEVVRGYLGKMGNEGKIQYFEAKKLLAGSGDVETAEWAELAQLVLLTQAATEQEVEKKVKSCNPTIGRVLDVWSKGVMKVGEWLSGRSKTLKDKWLGKAEGVLKSSALGIALGAAFGAAGSAADKSFLLPMQIGIGATFASAGTYKFVESLVDKKEMKRVRSKFESDFNETRLENGKTPVESLLYIQKCLNMPEEEKNAEIVQFSEAVKDVNLKKLINFWSAALRGGREDDRLVKYLLTDGVLRKQVELMCNVFYNAENWLDMRDAEDRSKLAKLFELQKIRGEEIARAEEISFTRRFGRWGMENARKISTFVVGGVVGGALGFAVGRFAPEIMRKLGILSSPEPVDVSPSGPSALKMAMAEGSDSLHKTLDSLIASSKNVAAAGTVSSNDVSGGVSGEVPVSTPKLSVPASTEISSTRASVGAKLVDAPLERAPSSHPSVPVESLPTPEVRPANILDFNHPGSAEQNFAFTHKMNQTVFDYYKQLQNQFPALRDPAVLDRVIGASKFSHGRQAVFPELQGRNGINTMDEAGGQFKLKIIDELMQKPGGTQEAARFLVMQKFSGHGLSNMGIDQHDLPGTPGSEQYNIALARKFEEILSGYSSPKTHSAVVRELFSGLQHNSSRMLANNDITSVVVAKGEVAQFCGYNEFNPHEPVIGGVKGWNVSGQRVVPVEAHVPAQKASTIVSEDSPRSVAVKKPVALTAEDLSKESLKTARRMVSYDEGMRSKNSAKAMDVEDLQTTRKIAQSVLDGDVKGKSFTEVFYPDHTRVAGGVEFSKEAAEQFLADTAPSGSEVVAGSSSENVAVATGVESAPGSETADLIGVPEQKAPTTAPEVVESARNMRYVAAPKLAFDHSVAVAPTAKGVSVADVVPDSRVGGGKVPAVEVGVELPATYESRVDFLAREINNLNLGYEDVLGSGDSADLIRDILHPDAKYLDVVMDKLGISADKYFGSSGASVDNSAESLLEKILGKEGVGLPKEQVEFLLGNNNDFSSYAGVGTRAVEAMVGMDNATQFIKVLSADGSHWDLVMDEKYRYFVGDTGDLYRIPMKNFGVKSEFSIGEGMENTDGAELVTKIK